ncbi:tRNA (cmo5U34)-methyltransferase [Bradyrhizobium huanghuaihaiense]|uniref:tRNA (Cmo5U34)-methyltransferase n=1 Tax=Bradyrhizobium huanghuaihaiense TaxID=990078 RepID=A0A562R607_9BRAD|nr:class I SAM-dependent methyltransferase [Bradyrhizobium huanghuaihaiense]TWI63806.1 tRNA (cmo5U34)-methyltransferase [Bradyrhizobium huanghuaihaiense]
MTSEPAVLTEMSSYNIPRDFWDSERFDSLRRQLIPSFDLLYATGADFVGAVCRQDARILDIGAGTGLFSGLIRARLPRAVFTLLDASPEMLSKAVHRMGDGAKCSYLHGDFSKSLPEGRYDVVVSALAIHHLTHADKRALFCKIFECLTPNGLFVNVEQLAGSSSAIEQFYDRQHERHVHDMETPPEEWARGRERMKLDIPADLLTQLDWLRSAGFSEVECLAKDCRFATYAAWKR